MKKKLYYVIEKETFFPDDNVEQTTGMKMITIYDIENNIPTVLTTLECSNEDDTKEQIQEYLDDNGMGDDDFEFIVL